MTNFTNTFSARMRFFLLLLAFGASQLVAQTPQPLPHTHLSRFDLPFAAGDTARVLVSGQTADFQQKKGVFLFVHGSLPTPLALFQDTLAFGVWPFDYRDFASQYHFVAVSKPGLPLTAQIKELDERMCYTDPATGRPPQRFRENNHLDYYVAQHSAVLDWLLRQPWADASRVVVCGGSQGATVASRLASVHPRVTHLIYYSGNPNGRLDEEARRIQQDVAKGKTNGAEAAQKLEELQGYWAWLYANAEQTDNPTGGDVPKTTVSFSSPARAWLMQLNIPVLVAFGTADLTAAPCATLPLDFLRAGKNNLTLKVYANYDHHFFEQKADGTEPEYRMDRAFKEWMEWAK